MKRKRVDINKEKKIGDLLKFNRTLKNMSQAELAQKLDISVQQLRKYEMGTNRLSVTLIIETARILNMPIGNFIYSQYDLSNVYDEDYEILRDVSLIKNHSIKINIAKFMHNLAKVA